MGATCLEVVYKETEIAPGIQRRSPLLLNADSKCTYRRNVTPNCADFHRLDGWMRSLGNAHTKTYQI